MKELPEFVKSFINNRLVKDNVKVRCNDIGNGKFTELEFNSEGYAKVLEAKIHIFSYIRRLLTFCRKDIMIQVDGVKLDEIPFMLTNDK